mgnify:CR=1 FL=1|jgi:hypothetical protein
MSKFNYFSVIQRRGKDEWVDAEVYQANSKGKIKAAACQERFNNDLQYHKGRGQTRVVSRREPVYN